MDIPVRVLPAVTVTKEQFLGSLLSLWSVNYALLHYIVLCHWRVLNGHFSFIAAVSMITLVYLIPLQKTRDAEAVNIPSAQHL